MMRQLDSPGTIFSHLLIVVEPTASTGQALLWELDKIVTASKSDMELECIEYSTWVPCFCDYEHLHTKKFLFLH